MFSSTFLTAGLCAAVASAARLSDVSSCSSGPASKYMQLAEYPPAQSYCTDNYPSPATVTVTACDVDTTSTGASKRDDSHPQWRAAHPHTPSPHQSNEAILFQRLMSEDSSLLSTFCSCIASAPQIFTITQTCSSSEYCDPNTSTCKLARDCANPSSCDGHSFCGKDPSGGNLFCHPDTDDSSMGYCMNGGPPHMGCPEPYEDCSSNADCGGQRVCIYSCCRTEPFCVDVRDYQSGSNASQRLMRRNGGVNPP